MTIFKSLVGRTQPAEKVSLTYERRMVKMTIEERIQELRKSKGLSQEQLAETLGVSRQAVSKWESGQSMPEIDKLIAMSTLFGVTIDYILKGATSPSQDNKKHNEMKLGSQVISAAATMLLLVGTFATFGQLSDGTATMDIYGGLIIESVGIMFMIIGWFLAGNKAPNKVLFVINILLAGIMPSLLISQLLLGLETTAIPQITPMLVFVFACIYLVLCGVATYFTVIRKKKSVNKKA